MGNLRAWLYETLTWRYGYVLGGMIARQQRFTGRIELRVAGEWKRAHATWAQHFRSF